MNAVTTPLARSAAWCDHRLAMTSQPPTSSDSGSAYPVLVRHDGRTWRLVSGRALTFGRGLDVDIKLAHEPPDLRVSRHTGTLRHLIDTVLIMNAFSRGMLTLMADGAVTREISPGEAITCDPHRKFRVCVIGEYGLATTSTSTRAHCPSKSRMTARTAGRERCCYAIRPDTRPTAGAQCPVCAATRREGALRNRPRNRGKSEPAAELCPNVLKETRERLAAQGVPGLLGEDNPQAVEALRHALAQWAIRNRVGLDF